MAKLEKMTDDQVQDIASDAVTSAISFIESEIAEDRIKSQRYFEGETDIGQEAGRSRIVATKVRDTIRAIKPSLMRVFLSSENAVEFVPTSQEDVKSAEQATKYANYRFNELNGYTLLNDVIHDALVKKTGVLKVWWEDNTEEEFFNFSNVTEEEMAAIVNEDDATVIEQSVEMSTMMNPEGIEMEMPQYTLKVSYKKEKGKLCIEALPPEEFIVDRNAKSVEDAYIVAHRTEMRVSDLVQMGYEYDMVSELSGLSSDDTYTDSEAFERKGYEQDEEANTADVSMKLVAVTEAYMKMDKEGTGVASMYRILMAGGDNKLLECEPWGEVPFAVFEIDPEPHTFFGRSVADLIMNDQDSSTAMLRGMMDNVALTNSPRQGYVQGQVNVDDLMNNEIGGLVRMKSPAALVDIATPFVAGQVLTAMQYMDNTIEGKTGVSKASQGLDPDALQNTSATAARLQAQQGSAQIEVMARNIAEGGMKRLFKLMLHLLVENSCEETMMRLHGEFVPIDPRSWNTGMDISTNVGLGTGKEETRQMALQQALTMQMQIWTQYGNQNGLVTMTGIRNTLGDMLALAGVKNIDRYFNPMTPETEQQLVQQQEQLAAQEQESALTDAQALVQSEQYNADKQMEMQQLKLQIEAQKAIAVDDRDRDKMDQDLLIKAAEILGKYGTAVDTANIKKAQEEARYPDATPSQAVSGGRF
tara:strand:+ start:1138 stop:3237 length:2100 start_codon:yes stop_codon:yes gene_type:complete